MSAKFKNRLIGTIIIVALTVILLPSLLDGDKQHYQEQFASIPLEPKVNDEISNNDFVPLSDKPIAEPVIEPTTESTAAEPVVAEPEEAKPEVLQPPKGEAYVVQLAALRNAQRVDEIVALLKLSNFRVYTLPSQPIQGEVTRIFVGPYAFKNEASSRLAELKELTGLEGQVRLYSTVKDKNLSG